MGVLKDYEREVLYTLASSTLSQRQLEAVAEEGELVSYEYTGCGYFLTLRHESLPKERVVCDRPVLSGSAGGLNCGFVIFIETASLRLSATPGVRTYPKISETGKCRSTKL
jgi:hypothetical protein